MGGGGYETSALCGLHRQCNLESFSLPTHDEESNRSMQELQRDSEIWVPMQPAQDCALCSLIARCATLANVDTNDPKIKCSIQPILTRISDSSSESRASSSRPDAHPKSLPVYKLRAPVLLNCAAPEDETGGKPANSPSKLPRPKLAPPRKWQLVFYETKELRKPVPSSNWGLIVRDRTSNAPPKAELSILPKQPSSDVQSSASKASASLAKMATGSDSAHTSVPTASTPWVRSHQYDTSNVKEAVGSWVVEAVHTPITRSDAARPFERVPIPPKVDFRIVRSWLDQCSGSHSHLSPAILAKSRLASIWRMKYMRGINTTTGQVLVLPKNAKYAALSYMWGSTSVQSSEVPRTVKGALQISRDLGFEWLWVDRLCIQQTNEVEKAALVPIMKDIYALAEITIVAAVGNHADCELPGITQSRNEEHPIKLKGIQLLPAPRSFNSLLDSCIWRTRGWTFQEYVFSRRLLYVFPSEIIFSCANSTFREATGNKCTIGSAGSTWGDSGKTPPSVAGVFHAKLSGDDTRQDKSISTHEFVQAVEEYTSRKLTFEEDRVNAFAGILNSSTSLPDTPEGRVVLLHGHPLQFFETALTWQHDGDSPPKTSSHGLAFAPSWSWASAGSKVHFLDDGHEGTKNSLFTYKDLEANEIHGSLVSSIAGEFISRTSMWDEEPPPTEEEIRNLPRSPALPEPAPLMVTRAEKECMTRVYLSGKTDWTEKEYQLLLRTPVTESEPWVRARKAFSLRRKLGKMFGHSNFKNPRTDSVQQDDDHTQITSEHEVAQAKDQIAPKKKATRLPTLHLLTVTFYAMLEPSDDDTFCLKPITGGTQFERETSDMVHDYHDARLVGNWSVAPWNRSVITEDPDKEHFFAVVGGNDLVMYVMLLIPDTRPDIGVPPGSYGHPAAPKGVYLRGGLYKSPLNPKGAWDRPSYAMRDIMARGRKKWENIVIA